MISMIRTATNADWETILKIYIRAREYMRQTGNPNQWKDDSPSLYVLREDIQKKQLFVLEDSDGIQGVFALIPGEDPTYRLIEGRWLNNAPYAAIHRVASAGRKTGVLEVCLQYCQDNYRNLRIDTHEDNKIMQHLLIKFGFLRCGIIYLENGDSRIAYQRTR